MMTFRYTAYAQEIIFGLGALAQVGNAIEHFHWQRVMVCTSPSLRPSGHVTPIETALGPRLVAMYERTQSHVLDFQLAEALALATAHAVDAVIGLGGGSAIGLAKAVSFALEDQRLGRPARVASPTDQPLVPVIAIPTTYAGSEMTPVYGITRQQTDGTSRKVTVKDVKIAPKLVLYDPALTASLPSGVTAGTGLNALAHCVEALYSTTRHPLSTAAALSGIQHITRALPRCWANAHDLEARTQMMLGAHLAGTSLATVTMAIHHGLCHVLGGTAGVAHGIANGIMLPHAMRFNMDVVAPQLAQAAEAMGIARDGQSDEAMAEAAIRTVDRLVRQLGLPQRLRDVNVDELALPKLAQVAFENSTVQNNPKRVTDVAQLEAVLREAW
jgi:maleylacetate reductase